MALADKTCPVGFPGLMTQSALTLVPLLFAFVKDSASDLDCLGTGVGTGVGMGVGTGVGTGVGMGVGTGVGVGVG